MEPSGRRPWHRIQRLLPPIPNVPIIEQPHTSGRLLPDPSHLPNQSSGEQRQKSRYHSSCAKPSPIRVQPGPSHVEPGPTHVQLGPSRVEQGPNLVQPGLCLVEQGTIHVQSGPSRVEPSPIHVQAGPSLVEPSPIQVQPEPFRVEPSPIHVQPGPSRVEPGPIHVQPDPSNLPPGPRRLEPGPCSHVTRITRSPYCSQLGPCHSEPGPSRVQPGPRLVQPTLSRIARKLPRLDKSPARPGPTPFRVEGSPARLRPGPSRIETSPARPGPSLLMVEKSPIRLRPGPSRLKTTPTCPGPGTTRVKKSLVRPGPNPIRVERSPAHAGPGPSRAEGGPSGIRDSTRDQKKEDLCPDRMEVRSYLDQNKDILEAYIVEQIPIEVIEHWFFKKIKQNLIDNVTHSSSRSPLRELKAGPERPLDFQTILGTLEPDLNEYAVVSELATNVASVLSVEAIRVYKLFPDNPSYAQCYVGDSLKQHDSKSTMTMERVELDQASYVLQVANQMSSLRISRDEDPHRFPETPQGLFQSFRANLKDGQANHILYQPVLTLSGKTGYVIELWRASEKFTETEEKVSSHFVVWGSIALHFSNKFLDKKKERNMADFLLDVVKAIFEEMVSLDQLIKRILEFAQRLVNADRASLFLVDKTSSELVSTVFDLKFEAGQEPDLEKNEIRMPINRGIAGHVAMTGQIMNIPDAYSDCRFNRDVDEKTGYKTVSILCMPVKVKGEVIGVVQMVNKRNEDNFDRNDEMSFENFSTFFGLALHHARLYDKIMRKEQKYRVALEVLSYHNTCRENEVESIMTGSENIDVDLNDFYLDPYQFTEIEKCKCVISMFDDLFNLSRFDVWTFTRFVLTVKKNYRAVPYHNFDHGWSVAHTMYVILKNDNKERFNYQRRLALFIASLCHDLDHRGYTNKYMSETASPLAAMYTTSTLEHHHFNITVTILQQDGHNIFAHVSSEEYKEILGYIRQAILATDLVAFFPNLMKMKELHDKDIVLPVSFDWERPSHIDLAMAISMTAADLSASAKPWDVQIKTVKVIFEEFYDQGDKERATGKTPIPMMDRNKPHEQPDSQIGFLSQICLPCYSMLTKILPHTEPMHNMAMQNLERWKLRAALISYGSSTGSYVSEPSGYSEYPEEDGLNTFSNTIEDLPYDDTEVMVPESQEEIIRTREASQDSWEETTLSDTVAENVERLTVRVWQEESGSDSTDEEGVVVGPNALKGLKKKIDDEPTSSSYN